MPVKKKRGIIARFKAAPKKKAVPKAKKTTAKKSYPAGGYANPKPRKKRLDEAGNWSKPKKKK